MLSPPQNDYLLNKWKDAYYGAQRCNLALNVMKEAADMDETTKANRTAELKFLRALFMFEGVKIFGPTGMPISMRRSPLKKRSESS